MNPENQELPSNINLRNIWSKLIEEYSIANNTTAYSSFISEIRNNEILRNKIITCSAARELLVRNINTENAINTLLYFGIKYVDIENLDRRISKEVSSLNRLDSQLKSSRKKIYINFWKMLADIEFILKRPISINIDNINALYWIELNKQARQIVKPNGRKG